MAANPTTPIADADGTPLPASAPRDLSDEELEALEADLVTEDNTPVDGIYSERLMKLLTTILYASWVRPGDKPFAAMANVGLFFKIDEPPVVPDVLVSDGVKVPDDLYLKRNRSYFLWRYGKPPELVIEIVSNREGGELDRKKRLYARIGVAYYVVWDPMQFLGERTLALFELQGAKYVELTKAWFPILDLGLQIWHGTWDGVKTDWLRWIDASGQLLPSSEEKAELERQRADRLAEKLRSHGIDPET